MPSDSEPRPLPPDRAQAVDAWLSTTLGMCRACARPVYPTDSRVRDLDERDAARATLLHLACLQTLERA
jgi:hypothetical protein